MKKLILPLALTVTMFSGCASPFSSLSGRPAPSSNQSAHLQANAAADPTLKQTSNRPSTVDQSATIQQIYVRVPDSQIDFNHLMIDCNISQEMIYVKQGDKIIRSFPTSSGLDTIPDNTTPQGTFTIQPERGTWFYSEQYQEGAKYWVSFKDHGVFLFHSVVMDKDGNIKQDELKKLGTKASHGCFRIPLDDAKWIYDNIKVGTKVWIHT